MCVGFLTTTLEYYLCFSEMCCESPRDVTTTNTKDNSPNDSQFQRNFVPTWIILCTVHSPSMPGMVILPHHMMVLD